MYMTEPHQRVRESSVTCIRSATFWLEHLHLWNKKCSMLPFSSGTGSRVALCQSHTIPFVNQYSSGELKIRHKRRIWCCKVRKLSLRSAQDCRERAEIMKFAACLCISSPYEWQLLGLYGWKITFMRVKDDKKGGPLDAWSRVLAASSRGFEYTPPFWPFL